MFNALELDEAELLSSEVTCIVREHQLRLYGHIATPYGRSRPSDSVLSESVRLDHAVGLLACFFDCVR